MNSESAKIDYFSDEIKELIVNAQNGDKNSLEELTVINTPLINSILKRYLSYSISYDDLFQIGAIGLIKAIKRFSFEFNTKFSTYAVYVINGEYKRYFRDEGIIKVGRNLKTIYLKTKTIREDYVKKNGVEPSIDYLSEKIGVSSEDVLMALEACRQPESLSKELNTNENTPILLMDKIKDENDSNEKIVEKLDLKNAIMSLEKRDRQIIVLRYFKNKTQKEVAEVLGLSQVQVSRLEKKIIENMKKTFES